MRWYWHSKEVLMKIAMVVMLLVLAVMTVLAILLPIRGENGY